MPSTIAFSRGAVVLVRFPFTDHRGGKQRPALVISTDSYSRHGDDVILAAITSQRFADPEPYDHPLEGWKSCGLLHPSVVRAGKIVTLDRSMIRRTLGRIPSTDLAEVESRVREALGLT